MSNTAKAAGATLADLLAIPEERRRHEIIDGTLFSKAHPSAILFGPERAVSGAFRNFGLLW